MPTHLARLPALGSLILAAIPILFSGCDGRAMFLSARDREIEESTRAIQTAGDPRQRAKAYSSRGHAYSEKARYSRISRLISTEEYERLFGLAIKDHNEAVALDPGNPEVYFNRGEAYYQRGSQDFVYSTEPWIVPPATKSALEAAAADFERALEKDPRNEHTLDMLGLTYEQAGDEDKAVRAYTQEMALNPLGKQRLADAYCSFGFRRQQQKNLSAAAEAYRKSTEFGQADDKSCPNDPFANAVAIYTSETHDYDKAWQVVQRALKAGHAISPDLIQRLTKASQRSN